MGSRNKGSSTTTQSVNFPDWYQAAATANTAPWMTPSAGMVAGMNDDQMMAGNLTRQNAQNAYSGTDYAGKIMEAGGAVTGQDALDLANPFYKSVGRDTIDTMRRERDNASAQIGARNANAVAFGGSGSALERAQLNRNHLDQSGKAINTILAQGYDRGMSAAQQNAQRQMQAAQAASGVSRGQFADRRNAASDLLGYGGFTQAQAQQALDIPYLALQRYQSLLPGSQTSTQPITWNPLETLLGAGLGAAGIYQGFTK